jgi:flagellar biogenesis protein FliO
VSPIATYMLQTGLTLVGVVLLAWLVLYTTRKLGGPPVGGPLQLLGRLPLEGRRAVYLVKVDDRVLVLGSSEAGISKLAELNGIPESILSSRKSPGFADVLARLRSETTDDATPNDEPQTQTYEGKGDSGS